MHRAVSRGTQALARRLLNVINGRVSSLACSLVIGFLVVGPASRWAGAEEEEEEGPKVQLTVEAPGTRAEATRIAPVATAVVNMTDLAREEALHPRQGPVRTWMPPEPGEPAEPYFPAAPEPSSAGGVLRLLVPSPSPTTSFVGLDDIAMVDSSYIVIPPDVGGAVGPDRVMCTFNNNYRIQNKSTGATILTVGTATFWGPVVAASERANLTDPRTTYDPYNDRWIAAMQTFTTNAGKILIGVSQTSDPAGAWNLYSFNTAATVDFPILGFNKNWISVSINRYTGGFQRGINLVLDYPSARSGTGVATLFQHTNGTHFCSAPCVTYSASAETLYVVTHLSSSGATYQMDVITGTPGSPVYTSGGTQTRTGGGWVQPGGNLLPQSAPNSGSSACGATPCPIEVQDAQIRSAPTYRDGFIYYAQTIGLPSTGLTHTAVQWTRIATPSGAYSLGGRVDDPTATSTNGGKWYAYPHIALNSSGDFMVGYAEFSSAQHPSAGYSFHLASDGDGVLREPLIYHTGEDYYHKTFSTATGRNRWGDYSTTQVDPSDDETLWALQQFGKTRTGTNDGNTGSNSSRWSSWWAGVAGQGPTFTLSTSVLGGGSLTVVPDQALYDFGDSVQVTPVPDAGWDFDQWTGDASGSANPLVLVMDSDKSITGVFVDVEPPGGVAVLDPNGTEVWDVGSTQAINWTASDNAGVTAVDLFYSLDGGATYPETIATGLANSGSYSWTVPATPSTTARVRVTARDAAGNETSDDSDADFEIHDTGTAVPLSALAGRDALAVYPNPSRPGSMHVLYSLKSPAAIDLSVFDVRGRLLRRLSTGPFSGARELVWDGRDQSGHALPAGSYFIRLTTTHGVRLNKQVTILR